MYGYNAGQPMAIPIYTVLPYCVILRCYMSSAIIKSSKKKDKRQVKENLEREYIYIGIV